MLNISTQRGCSLPCCFCTYPLIEGRDNRRRQPDAVADELAAIQRQGAKHVFIADAVFNLNNEHVAGVCEAILRRGIRLDVDLLPAAEEPDGGIDGVDGEGPD